MRTQILCFKIGLLTHVWSKERWPTESGTGTKCMFICGRIGVLLLYFAVLKSRENKVLSILEIATRSSKGWIKTGLTFPKCGYICLKSQVYKQFQFSSSKLSNLHSLTMESSLTSKYWICPTPLSIHRSSSNLMSLLSLKCCNGSLIKLNSTNFLVLNALSHI